MSSFSKGCAYQSKGVGGGSGGFHTTSTTRGTCLPKFLRTTFRSRLGRKLLHSFYGHSQETRSELVDMIETTLDESNEDTTPELRERRENSAILASDEDGNVQATESERSKTPVNVKPRRRMIVEDSEEEPSDTEPMENQRLDIEQSDEEDVPNGTPDLVRSSISPSPSRYLSPSLSNSPHSSPVSRIFVSNTKPGALPFKPFPASFSSASSPSPLKRKLSETPEEDEHVKLAKQRVKKGKEILKAREDAQRARREEAAAVDRERVAHHQARIMEQGEKVFDFERRQAKRPDEFTMPSFKKAVKVQPEPEPEPQHQVSVPTQSDLGFGQA